MECLSFSSSTLTYYHGSKNAALTANLFIPDIIKDFIYSLDIINQRTYHPVDLEKWQYKTLRQRFKIPKEFSLEKEKEIGAGDGNYYEDTKRIHYISDFLCTLLQEVRKEMHHHEKFNFLQRMLVDMVDMKEDEYFLINKNQKENYKMMNAEINILQNKITQIMTQHFPLIDKLKSEYGKIKLERRLEEYYMTNWENSRKEQCILKHKIENTKLEQKIQQKKIKIDDELSAHMSIMSYLWLSISDMSKEVDLWIKKYELDNEKKRNEIFQIKDKRDEIRELIVKKQDAYQRREKEIDKYLTWKEQNKDEIKAKEAKDRKLTISFAKNILYYKKAKKSKSKKSRRKA